MNPVRERGLLPNSDFATIFGDLPSIIQVNRELMTALESSQDRIGKVFLELAPYLKFYSTYANDFQSAVKLVEYWTEKNKAFRTLISNQESRPEVKHKLNALLITPIQRIPRYKLLLEDVIKNTPDSHPDKTSLKEALEQIEHVAWHINEQLREHENNMKMVDIQKSLNGGFPKIIAPGRKLLKQGMLLKVPRTGGGASHGQPRYFVLFSDMIMYCKIQGKVSPILPKTNGLECGCMLPLKNCKVETLVGKGVFKLICQREELILYSNDGSQSSEEWVGAISTAIIRHKSNSATLRKESSRRDPVKRPDIMKMRRESLGQILLLRKGILTPGKHKMVLRERKDLTSPGNSPIVFSPRSKKRPAPIPMELEEDSATPSSKSIKMEEPSEAFTPKRIMAPPEVPNVQIRAKLNKKINKSTSAWKTLSLSRRDKVKSLNSQSQIFRSPSIYENQELQNENEENEGTVMKRYLSGKFCPLTPSQQPTNVEHLVQNQPNTEIDVPASPTSALASSPMANYCSIM